MGQQVSESRRVFLSTTAEIVHGKRRSFLRAGNVKSELPSLRVDMGSNIFHTYYNGTIRQRTSPIESPFLNQLWRLIHSKLSFVEDGKNNAKATTRVKGVRKARTTTDDSRG